jgi:hypothetical protein
VARFAAILLPAVRRSWRVGSTEPGGRPPAQINGGHTGALQNASAHRIRLIGGLHTFIKFSIAGRVTMNPFANLMVNLLMLALGLGSFKIAAGAIFTGVAEGASSAMFPFATKPFAFLLVVGAWLGLGILMLYAAWRGVVNPQDPDPDDEQDDRPPVAQPSQSSRADQSQPAVRVALGPQRSMSSFDHFIQHAKSPGPLTKPVQPPARHHAGAISPEPGYSSRGGAQLPEPLQLYKSRVYAGTWLAVMTLYTVAMVFVSVGISGVLGQRFASFIFAISFAIYMVIAVKCIRDWRRTEPALTLDKYGITDHFHGGQLIPWTDIKGIRLSSPSATTSLVLQFAHADLVRTHFGSAYLPHAVLQRIFCSGFEARIALTSLSFQRAQLMQLSQVFLKHARR